MKKIFVLLLSLLLIIPLASCKKKEEEPETLDYCENIKAQGGDLNLAGCFIDEPIEGGYETWLYVPDADGLGWNRTKEIKTYTVEDQQSAVYLARILSVAIFGEEECFNFLYSPVEDFVRIQIAPDTVDKFIEKYEVQPLANGEVDKAGVAQVLLDCVNKTAYANIPRLKVVYNSFIDSDKITPISDEIYFSKELMIPMFFGSENSWVGTTSYSNFVEQLASNGIKLDDYTESDRLFIVNSFLYDSIKRIEEGKASSNTESSND